MAQAVTNPIANFLFGGKAGALGSLQDIVSGIIGNQTAGTFNQASNQALQTAQSLQQQSAKETDPTKKRALYDQAQNLLSGVSQSASQRAGTFSPGVTTNPIARGVVGGTQIGVNADLLSKLGNLIVGGARSLAPQAAQTSSPYVTDVSNIANAPSRGPWGGGWNNLSRAEVANTGGLTSQAAAQGLPATTATGLPGIVQGLLGAAKSAQANPLVRGAELVGGLVYGRPILEEALGGIKSLTGMAGKPTAAGPQQTPEARQKQLDADVPNPIDAGTVKLTTDLAKNVTDLQQLQGTQEYAASKAFDPLHVYANKVDAQLENANTQLGIQRDMQANYTTTAALDQQYNNVINAIGGNTGFAKSTDWYKEWQASGDPAFNEFLALLPALKAQGVDTDKIINGTGDSAKAAIEGAKTQMLEHYKSAYKTYGSTPFSPISVPAPAGPTTPTGPSFIPGVLGGGAGAGLPKAGAKGLPSLQPNGLPMKHKVQIPPRYLYR